MRGRFQWVLAVVVAVIWAGGLRAAIWWHERAHPTKASDDAGESGKRAVAVALVPRLKPPARVVGAADVERLDARDVIALLRAGRTAELNDVFEAAQDLFERDMQNEKLVESLFGGLDFAGPDDLPRLNAWVAASPTSFAALVGRAVLRITTARKERAVRCDPGERPALGARAKEAYALARRDLEQALALRPGLVAAHTRLIEVAAADGSAAPRSLLNRATAICPGCLAPRVQYMTSLRPAWGGSREAMVAFAEESQARVAENPGLRSLLGYPDLEDCWSRTKETQYEQAIAACDRAISLYPAAAFWMAKASALFWMGKYTEVAEAESRALAEHPLSEEALVERARAYSRTDSWEAAGADLKVALQLAPTDEGAGNLWVWLLDRLEWDVRKDMRGPDMQKALKVYDLALRIAPGHPKFLRARTSIRSRLGLSAAEGSHG